MSAAFVLPLRVAFADTDASGRFHWTAVFRYAELAEHALLRELGRPDVETIPYPRRSAEVAYHRSLRAGDEFEVRLGVEKIGRTSVVFGWQLVRDGECHVEGRHTVVHVGDDGSSAPWPEYLVTGLRALGNV